MNISGIHYTVRYQNPLSQSRLGLLITFENPNLAICGAASLPCAYRAIVPLFWIRTSSKLGIASRLL